MGDSGTTCFRLPEVITRNNYRARCEERLTHESAVMEAVPMRPVGLISMGVLVLLLGAVAPAFALQEQRQEEAKPQKQEQQAKPQKQQEAKPQKQEQQAKPARQEQRQAKGQQRQEQKQQQQARGQQQQQDKAAKQQEQQQAKGRQQEQQQKQQQQQAKGQQQQQDKDAKQQEQQQAKGRQEQQQKQQQQQAKGQQQQQDRVAKQQEHQQAKGRQEQQQVRGQQDQQRQQHEQAANRTPQDQHREAREQHSAWQGDRAHSWKTEHRTWQQRGGYNGYRIPDERYNGYFGESHGFRIYSQPVVFVGGSPRFQYGGFWFGFVDPWPEYWSDDWYDNDDVYVAYSDDGYYMYDRRYPRDRIAISVSLN